MALELEYSVTIARPIEEVFDYVTAHENDEEWKSLVVDAPPIDEEMSEGTTWDLKVKMLGLTQVLNNECTEFERPHRFGYRNGGSVATEGLYIFEEEGEETRVTWEGTTEFTGVMRLLKPIFGRSMANEIESNMMELKNVLENQAGTG